MKFNGAFYAAIVILPGICMVLSSGCTGDRGEDLKSEARNAYMAEKGKYSGFKLVEIDAGDEAYAWTERKVSQTGILKSNAVAIVDFETSGGIGGSFSEAKALAEEIESVLADYQ